MLGEAELVEHRGRPEHDVVAVADVDPGAERVDRRSAAPDLVPGFEQQRRDAGPREVRRADEPVVARADHDRAVVHRASYDATDGSSSPGRPPRAASGRADRARLDPDPTPRSDRTARPPPAVLDRPGDRRRGGRGRGARARRRARPLAAPAARVHEVERARLVRGHGLAVGDDVARGARRHRPVAGDTAGEASRLPQRARWQLVVAERRLSRAAAEVRADDVPRAPVRAARSGWQGRDRPGRRAGDGRARRHRRDLVDAAPAARARRSRCGLPQRPRGPRREPVRAFRRPGQLRVAVERLRPERPHRRSDRGRRPSEAKPSSKRRSRRSVRRSSRCARSRCLAADAVAAPAAARRRRSAAAPPRCARRDQPDRGRRQQPTRADRRRQGRSRLWWSRGCATSASTSRSTRSAT